ncbi:hypothetical protein D3C73_1386680 [compost metagenome]
MLSAVLWGAVSGSAVLFGASLISGQGVSLLLVTAIFISNIPEGLSSAAGLKQDATVKAKWCCSGSVSLSFQRSPRVQAMPLWIMPADLQRR